MKIDVRDQSFDITFVNNYCRERYQDMLTLIDEVSGIPEQYEVIKDSEDSDKAKLSKMKELNSKQHELTKSITEIRTEIIKELLETNEYEYDQKFWKRKTDVDDLNDFMLTCMQKDVKGKGSKKK
jgi:hypothetical protein